MFDVAWSEMFLVGIVALVAIGPKDLPKAMLMLGKLARQARQFGSDIRQQLDQLTYEAETAAKQANEAKSAQAESPPEPGTPP